MRTIGNRSYAMDFELRTGETFDDGTLAADGSAAHVFFDPLENTVRQRPDWFLPTVAKLEGRPEASFSPRTTRSGGGHDGVSEDKEHGGPSLGLGTYRLTGEACVRAVGRAISIGYRHVDTAQMYGNEAEVGRHRRLRGRQEEIFLTTKVWPSDFAHDRVIRKTRRA